ncbi:hypothetical protein [Trichocoleus sp. DQ-U1]|uniref:hypothetical protein n=1 Tax=Trichocoleus sp. DQ-U1 TaxID=2933926 RepID=UPI003298BF9C
MARRNLLGYYWLEVLPSRLSLTLIKTQFLKETGFLSLIAIASSQLARLSYQN